MNRSKNIYQWQISIWKNTQYHTSLEKYKLKPKWVISAYILVWSKSRTLTTQNYGKNVEQHGLSFIIAGNEKWYSHFRRQSKSHFHFFKPVTEEVSLYCKHSFLQKAVSFLLETLSVSFFPGLGIEPWVFVHARQML